MVCLKDLVCFQLSFFEELNSVRFQEQASELAMLLANSNHITTKVWDQITQVIMQFLFLPNLCVCVCVYLHAYACMLSRVWISATPWTVARQAALSMELSKQEYWSELPFASPGVFPSRDWTYVSCRTLHFFCIGRWVLYQLSYWGSPSNFMLLTNSFKILEL